MISILIAPAYASTAQDLPDHLPHDIYELIPYSQRISLLWLAALGILGVLLLWALYKLIRRWLTSRKVIPMRDPLEDHLKHLALLLPPQPFEGAAYFYALSWQLRELLEALTNIRATDLTLREFTPQWMEHFTHSYFAKLDSPRAEDILAFLSRADMIKFSGAATHVTEATQSHQQVLAWAQAMVTSHRQHLKELAQKKDLP